MDPMSTTCTVVIGASMQRCGAPAVATFQSTTTGDSFAECADHVIPFPSPEDVRDVQVGDRVDVNHVGIDKVGVVEKAGRVMLTVRVPLADGRTKLIHRAVDEVIVHNDRVRTN